MESASNLALNCGVSQECVLGPVLFLLLISDMHQSIDKSSLSATISISLFIAQLIFIRNRHKEMSTGQSEKIKELQCSKQEN